MKLFKRRIGGPGSDESERGAAAIIVAGSLIMLFGVAALAVDTSDFYQTARVSQTTADLACLAGVNDLPDTAKAFTNSVAYAKANWPDMAGVTATGSGDTRTLDDGAGNVVTIQTNYNGDPDKMYVKVTDRNPTTFGKVIGTNSVDVAQEASCERDTKIGGPGAMPMGALPGTFSGNLFDCSAKVTGNCGGLDVGSGANDWRDAIGNGWSQQLEKHHGPEGSADSDTGHAVIHCPTSGVCSANDTETGNMSGPFRQGLTTRLSKIAGADCVESGDFNCDSITQVFGSTPATLNSAVGASAPAWWEDSLYGPYSSVRNSQYYFDGDIAKCDSPRLGVVPIVAASTGKGKNAGLNWDIGDAPGTWPNGKKEVKVIGFYIVYIREPDKKADLGSGPIVGDVVHLGPNATCDGQPYNPYATGIPVEELKLVQP